MSSLHILQASVKWRHMEHLASSLLDAYSGLLSHQAMILAINSSFVNPLWQFEAQLKIVESSFKLAFSVPNVKTLKEMVTSDDDYEDLERLYQNILNIYEDTLLILVSKDLYKLQILKTSVDAPCLGDLAAELALLCSHADPSITQQASFGMYHLLCIAKCQNADFAKTKHKMFKKSGYYSTQLHPFDIELLPKLLSKERSQIAQSVGQSLMPSLLTDFVWNLLMKLSAPDYKVASEAATMLRLILEHYAHKVTMVSKIVDTIYKQLCGEASIFTKHAMLRVVTLLTRTSPKKVIFQLMDYPVPADSTLILMWQAAGSEASVAPHVLKTILLILRGKPGEMQEILMERRHFSIDATNMMPVAASQALCTLLPVGSYKKAVAQLFPQLLVALMLQLFYANDPKLTAKDWPLFSRDALRILLKCSGLQQVDYALQRKNYWNEFAVLFHHHGVYIIAKTLSEFKFPQFPETLHYLYKLSVEGPRRSEDSVVITIFFTELLNNFFEDPFPEEFLILFQNWINDSNPTVCKLSLQKIASMAPVVNEIENVCNLLLSIVGAFSSKDKTVIIRALLTLRRLLVKLDKVTYSSVCNRIACSYCPLMDHNNGGVRSMAIRHFGELLKDMSQYTWMLKGVVFRALVPLILFLEDTEIRVVKACKYTLGICGSQLNWPITSLLEDEDYDFEMVVLNICNNFLIYHARYITDLISGTLRFLRSSRVYLRKASIILLGYLAKFSGHLLHRAELEFMLDAVDRMRWDANPLIGELVEKTYELLQETAYGLTTSDVKQSFRKLCKHFYFKKMKPIYNYCAMDLKDSLEEIKETKSDKEGLKEKNFEEI
ncbi:maestro heat-like repeat-containing protein family member 9 isoform X3 [Tamandua tetradactyla]|uniref:maestro heat-like repeat-containing protein family member 9 isoform X3 n=1 Tax=Tamandua tetradactyla TaxID=48850 RepID=UPI004054680A